MTSALETKSVPPQDVEGVEAAIEREIERKLDPEIMGKLDPKTKSELLRQTATVAVQFSGPIPPGFILQEIEDVIHGGADRIIAMAEKDQDHIHYMQRKSLDQPHHYALTGMFFGALICVVAVIASAYVSINGQPWAGAALFGAALVAVVGIFVKSRLAQQSEPERQATTPPSLRKKKR